MHFKFVRFIYKYLLSLFFLFAVLLPSPAYAFGDVRDGSVPSWITGEVNTLVMNMRNLAGKVSYKYFDTDGTTCCYSVSVSLRGTQYGASLEEYGYDTSAPHPGDITDVDILIAKAKENGDWEEVGSYEPQAGDCAVTVGWWNGYYQTGHVVMVTESGGCIYNGSRDKGGIFETDASAEVWYSGYAKQAGMKPVAGYITTSKYSNGAGGVLNNAIDWGLDMLATVADSLNKLIEQFALYASEAMSAMHSIGLSIMFTLIIIDFASYLMLNSTYDRETGEMVQGMFAFYWPTIVSKILKYTFLLMIYMNWEWIVNNIFLDFAQSTASVFAGGANVSSNVTQPQFLLQKGVEALSPALNFISTAKGLTQIKNWPLLVFLLIITLGTLGFLVFSALYVAYVYIEFYLMAAFNAVFMIFPVSRHFKFIGEGGLGALVTATIKLFTTACLVFMIASLTDGATYVLDFPGDINELGNGTLRRYVMLCIHIIVFVILIIRIPDKIASMYSGKVSLPR